MSNLSFTVSECLRLASSKNHKSIAIPALGCGALEYPPDEVVAAIVTEILRCTFLHEQKDDGAGQKPAKSSSQSAHSTLNYVKIVVHPVDSDVIEV